MTKETLTPLAAKYLDRLRAASRRLPAGRRAELVGDIRAHLLESVRPDSSEAEVLSVLYRLGDPADIVDAEQPVGMAPVDARTTREWGAIILLLLGGFIFGVGWIVGLILLWSSRAWSTAEKWVGTLLVPGGLATGLTVGLLVGGSTHGGGESCYSFATGPMHCTPGPGMDLGDYVSLALGAFLILAPFATTFFLARRAGRQVRAG